MQAPECLRKSVEVTGLPTRCSEHWSDAGASPRLTTLSNHQEDFAWKDNYPQLLAGGGLACGPVLLGERRPPVAARPFPHVLRNPKNVRHR